MFYFIKENLKISKTDLEDWLINMDFSKLEKFKTNFDIEHLAKEEGHSIFKSMMYFSIEQKNMMLLKKLLQNGYFIKVKNNFNENEINFRDIPSGFVSHLGLFFDKDIFKFLIEDKNKINLLSAIKIVMKTNFNFYGKVKSLWNIYIKNNTKLNIHDTEIIHRIIEKEDLQTLMNINSNYLKDSKSIYYYLTSIKSEEIIKYIFSLNLKGDEFYNHLALSSLINNTERFKSFYLNISNIKVDSIIVSQILEIENIELLDFLYLNNELNLKYDDNIFKDIVFHCIYKNKLDSLKSLLKYWDYDFNDIEKNLKIYGKNLTSEMKDYIDNYRNKLNLNKKLKENILNKSSDRKKVEKI